MKAEGRKFPCGRKYGAFCNIGDSYAVSEKGRNTLTMPHRKSTPDATARDKKSASLHARPLSILRANRRRARCFMDSGESNYRTVNGRVKTDNVTLLATPINCCGTGGLNGWQPPEPPGV